MDSIYKSKKMEFNKIKSVELILAIAQSLKLITWNNITNFYTKINNEISIEYYQLNQCIKILNGKGFDSYNHLGNIQIKIQDNYIFQKFNYEI